MLSVCAVSCRDGFAAFTLLSGSATISVQKGGGGGGGGEGGERGGGCGEGVWPVECSADEAMLYKRGFHVNMSAGPVFRRKILEEQRNLNPCNVHTHIIIYHV